MMMKKSTEFIETIKSSYFITAFAWKRLKKIVQKKISYREQEADSIFVLRSFLKNQQEKDEYIKLQFIWFTYKDFKDSHLTKNTNVNNTSANQIQIHNTDAGWGCVIRAMQSMFSKCLFYHLQFISKNKQISKSERKYIIESFQEIDLDQQKKYNYSIKKFIDTNSKIGRKSQIIQIFYKIKNIHNSNPLEKFENLKVHVANNIIYLDQILKSMGYEDIIKIKGDNININKSQENKENIRNPNSILLLFFTGIQHQVGDLTNFQKMKSILRMKHSVGFIGGEKSQAYYFIGYQNNKFIHLDPHYTQQSHTLLDSSSMKTFDCIYNFEKQYNKLQISIGFGFYIEDLQSLKEFYDQLKNINCDNFLPIQLQNKNCNQEANNEVNQYQHQQQNANHNIEQPNLDNNNYNNMIVIGQLQNSTSTNDSNQVQEIIGSSNSDDQQFQVLC